MNYLLVNADYYIKQGKPIICLWGRDANGKLERFEWTGSAPYFYAPDERGQYKGWTRNGIVKVKKIICKLPYEVPKLRQQYESGNQKNHFEADVPYVTRCLIDRNIWAGFAIENGKLVPAKPPNVKPVVAYIDIENEVKSKEDNIKYALEGERQILSIICWVYNPNTKEIKKFRLGAKNSQEEYGLLKRWISFVKDVYELWGIDIFAGWNPQYDFGVITARCHRKGILYESISPMDYISKSSFNGEVRIKGCQIVDLKRLYEKYFQGKKFESYSLDNLAARTDKYGLNIPHPNFDYANKMNGEHLLEILEYNELDVKKCYLFDEKFGLIHHFEGIRIETGTFINDAITTTGYVDSLVLRLFHNYLILPSRQHYQKIDYGGGHVREPKKGIFNWVIALDFSQMYPTMIISRNMSPETLTLTEPEDGENYHEIDGVWFKKSPMGKVPEMFINLSSRRKGIKKEMKEIEKKMDEEGKTIADIKELEEKWDILDLQQYSIKQILAAMYGYFAHENSRMYCPEISKSTTFIGRFLIQEMMKYMEGKGLDVIYGDTDSILVITGKNNMEEAISLAEELEKDLNGVLQDIADKEGLSMVPKIEFEQAYERILFAGKSNDPTKPAKKRYAGLCVYNKGKPMNEVMIKGFEIRRSDSAPVTREIQKRLFDIILKEGGDEGEIRKYIRGLVEEFKTRPLIDIGIPRPLKENPEDYVSESSYQDVLYVNRVMANKPGYRKLVAGDRAYQVYLKHTPPEGRMYFTHKNFGTTKLKDVNRIALLDEGQFNDWKGEIDWETQIEKIVSNKINKVLEIIGLDVKMILENQEQTTLDKWSTN